MARHDTLHVHPVSSGYESYDDEYIMQICWTGKNLGPNDYVSIRHRLGSLIWKCYGGLGSYWSISFAPDGIRAPDGIKVTALTDGHLLIYTKDAIP